MVGDVVATVGYFVGQGVGYFVGCFVGGAAANSTRRRIRFRERTRTGIWRNVRVRANILDSHWQGYNEEQPTLGVGVSLEL